MTIETRATEVIPFEVREHNFTVHKLQESREVRQGEQQNFEGIDGARSRWQPPPAAVKARRFLQKQLRSIGRNKHASMQKHTLKWIEREADRVEIVTQTIRLDELPDGLQRYLRVTRDAPTEKADVTARVPCLQLFGKDGWSLRILKVTEEHLQRMTPVQLRAIERLRIHESLTVLVEAIRVAQLRAGGVISASYAKVLARRLESASDPGTRSEAQSALLCQGHTERTLAEGVLYVLYDMGLSPAACAHYYGEAYPELAAEFLSIAGPPSTIPEASLDAILELFRSGYLKQLREIAEGDVEWGFRIKEVLHDSSRAIDGIGPMSPALRREREELMPLVAFRALRRAVIRTIHSELKRRSDLLHQALDSGGAAWDRVIVGGGVCGAAAARALKLKNPDLSILVIDASELLAPDLARGGFVRSNSANYPARATDRNGFFAHENVHVPEMPTCGPIQVSDLSPLLFCPVQDIADAAAITLATSGAHVMYATVERVERCGAGAPARYRVVLSDGRWVDTDRVGLFTGFGEPNLVGFDEPPQALLLQETSSAATLAPGQYPKVMFESQFRALMADHDHPRDPFREDEDILVVGWGDAGIATCRGLVGLEGPGAYEGKGQLDAVNRGAVGRIHYVVGWNGPENVEQFLSMFPSATFDVRYTAVYYADLIIELENAEYSAAEEREQARGSILLQPGRVTSLRWIEPGGRRRLEVQLELKAGRRKRLAVDRVVLCIGSESYNDAMFRPLLASDHHGAKLPRIRASLHGDKKATFVGRKVPGEDVYLGGVFATHYATGDLVVGEEAQGYDPYWAQHIGTMNPRAVGLAESFLGEGRPRLTAPRQIEPDPETITQLETRAQAVIGKLDGGRPLRIDEGNVLFEAKVELAKALFAARFSPGTPFEAIFERNGQEIVVESSSDPVRLAELINANPPLVEILRRVLSIGPIQFRAETYPANAPIALGPGAIDTKTLHLIAPGSRSQFSGVKSAATSEDRYGHPPRPQAL